ESKPKTTCRAVGMSSESFDGTISPTRWTGVRVLWWTCFYHRSREVKECCSGSGSENQQAVACSSILAMDIQAHAVALDDFPRKEGEMQSLRKQPVTGVPTGFGALRRTHLGTKSQQP